MNQLQITNYFKITATMHEKVHGKLDTHDNKKEKRKARRSLSLKKPVTPTKVSKTEKYVNDFDVINHSSNVGNISDSISRDLLPDPVGFHDFELDSFHSATPSKVSKIEKDVNIDVINISSDDEGIFKSIPLDLPDSVAFEDSATDSSQSTVVYSLSPRTPPVTPKKTSITVFRSPSSREKYYSPSKKRNVIKRTPRKRNLIKDFTVKSTESLNCNEDTQFVDACQNMSDKTVFLLTIINKYLQEESLKKLLDEDSQSLLSKTFNVVKPGMGLVCRLYWRKEGWYKKDKIRSIIAEGKDMDDPSLQLMFNSLMENGFIKSNLQGCSVMTFEDYATVLNVSEIKEICKELKLKTQSKQDALEALREFSKSKSNIITCFTGLTNSGNAKRVLQMMNIKAGPCYMLSELGRRTLYKLYILMYLGMNYDILRENKLELCLINEKIKTETYPVEKHTPVDNASVVFDNNLDFERYIYAHTTHEEYLVVTDTGQKCEIVKKAFTLFKSMDEAEMKRYKSLPEWLRRYTPAYLYIKILETGIQDLKRDKTGKYHSLALEILSTLISQTAFRQHRKPDWYAEKALVLHTLFRSYDEAAEVLLEGFRSNLPEEAKDRMRPRALKIANQKNIVLSEHLGKGLLEHATKDTILEANLNGEHISKLPMDKTGRGKVKFETWTEEGRVIQDAEEYCITHYINSGQYTHGEHWEGRIVTTIFFLLFWDIIYTNPRGIRGVFLSHYQVYPLDLFCDSFYVNRKILIDDHLKKIEESTLNAVLSIMEDKWNTRPECELSGITRSVGWENVRDVAMCLGTRSLSALCRRLATNYRYTHSGFPDLTLWNIHTKQIKFVEVKTDTDTPSMKQIQWMHYLKEHGIDTGFCYVGMNTTRRKSRPQKS